jgi:hypothetical protein
MMLIQKEKVLMLFKIISLIFVLFMLSVFMKVVFQNEKVSAEIQFENDKSFFLDHLLHSTDVIYNQNDEIDDENCLKKYSAYYIYAVILGGYINVKRLYKMGPI